MPQADNIAIARELFGRLGTGSKPEAIAELFAESMTWDVPGDTSALPWIGRQSGRQAVYVFIAESAAKVERIRFDIDDILASDTRVVALGRLASRVKRTGKVIATDFAIILTIADGQIARFQMLEDSFAVSQAAHHSENPGDLQS